MIRTLWKPATAIGIVLAMLAGCSPTPPPPPPPPPPAPVPPPAPPPAPTETDWRDLPLMPGTWTYRRDERGSVALFGESQSDARFVVRCEMPARRIVFQRAGRIDSGEGVMAFQTSSALQSFAARNVDGPLPYVAAEADARDRLLDAIAFSRGRITVAVTGQPLLVVPNWAEMTRVFEDCRG